MLIAYVVLAWVQVRASSPFFWSPHCPRQLNRESVKWVFFGAYLAQRLPALFLTIWIVFFPPTPAPNAGSGTVTEEPTAEAVNDGPSRKAKVVLLLATVFCVSGDAPLSLWALAFGQSCVFWIGSAVDLLHLVYVIGLVLYFLFVRYEVQEGEGREWCGTQRRSSLVQYLRLMEEAIWSNVSRFGGDISPLFVLTVVV